MCALFLLNAAEVKWQGVWTRDWRNAENRQYQLLLNTRPKHNQLGKVQRSSMISQCTPLFTDLINPCSSSLTWPRNRTGPWRTFQWSYFCLNSEEDFLWRLERGHTRPSPTHTFKTCDALADWPAMILHNHYHQYLDLINFDSPSFFKKIVDKTTFIVHQKDLYFLDQF